MKSYLTQELTTTGWTEINKDWEYRKNNWRILRDTSSWWMVGTDSNPRVFDIQEPNEDETKWTANLIEHLCKMEDERTRLRQSLVQIKTETKEKQTVNIANRTLGECYHTWLVQGDNLHCPICNSTKKK